MRALRLIAVFLTFMVIGTHNVQAADMVIGVPDWPSARATANIIKVIIEDRLSLPVELREADNQKIFEGMDAGTIQLHPEVWLPNQNELYQDYVEAKRSVSLSPLSVDASQGICATRATVEIHGIKSIQDLTDPEKAKIFDTDFNGKGEMWIGQSDWASTQVVISRARLFGYDRTMTLLQGGEPLALAAIDVAVSIGKPLVFYCYTPHHVFALHDIVRLGEPDQDQSTFAVASGGGKSGGSENAASATFGNARFHIAYAASLADSMPQVAKLLRQIRFDTDMVTGMTYALVVERQDPAFFAKQWVETHSDEIDRWVR